MDGVAVAPAWPSEACPNVHRTDGRGRWNGEGGGEREREG